MTPEKPITERINPKTNNIDIASPLEIVSLLEDCDAEIFKGWGKYPDIYNERIQKNIDAVSEIVVSILKNSTRNSIILSGCGTSGRIAFSIARSFNDKLRKFGITPCFDYLLAGGDVALFTSQESGEDDPVNGRDQLIKATKGKKKVLFIGITCGLSAPFVAGQLDYCLQHLDKFIPVIIGFNPIQLARNLPVENWHKTFLQVLEDLISVEGLKKGFLINPIVGPEPITGSSRMKGGTATKLILESIFVSALSTLHVKGQNIIAQLVLNSYETVYQNVYKEKEQIAKVVKLAGKSLNSGGYIYYVGWDSLGIMGLIDASECQPTYGACSPR
ncbi:glucokinase regulatory protein [Patella vulgata]|uniref:glucokinase regulatory protein n=1 Tax=Patella vulgata TaxID=6465 RepID=UPI0021801B90|nr:glucokinase regulatory protein [Patella vulgata]